MANWNNNEAEEIENLNPFDDSVINSFKDAGLGEVDRVFNVTKKSEPEQSFGEKNHLT